MRLSYIIVAAILFFVACKSGTTTEKTEVSTDTLMDSTELKMKADTAKKQIMHIGDSIEQMQRQAESEAAN